MEFEILSPAGSQESLIAGVRCGANAVYLGGKSLNARRNAGNFNDEELLKAVEYCHNRNVKVYQTLNTLCGDNELSEAYDAVKKSLEFGVDGFIVQDLGVAKMMHDCFPSAKLHASTQMSIMTPAGVAELKEMGFVRAVLPREMTADEIAEIRKSTDMELEIFVHGALCMSVSGQCYLSAMIGGRSGNRGLCAQPCRLPFSADKSGSCDLSLKDLSLVNHLKELGDLGTISLKIEGRMKRPEYVAAAVTGLKKAINGNYDFEYEQKLKSVFSRSGFTAGYFENRRGSEMFGTRQKEDVVSAKSVLKDFSHLYDNENPLVPMDMDFVCESGKQAKLSVSALGKTAVVLGSVPEKAINKPMDEAGVAARLSKLGGTQFFARNVNVRVGDGLILPASVLNGMRREAVEKINCFEKKNVNAKPFNFVKSNIIKGGSPYFTARFANANQIPNSHPFKRVFIPIQSSVEDFVDNRAGVEIPRGLFGKEQEVAKRLTVLKKAGVKNALCGNLGSYKLARDLGFNVFGDFGLNIYNSLSASQINSPVLSFELTVDNANKINANDTGLIVYGRLPLMLTRNCPVKAHIGCENCGKNGSLTDRKGITFPVVCSSYPCVELLNSVPVYMADRMKEVKTDFAHFYFTSESKKQVEEIISLYENGSKPPFDYTRGLYYRGVL